MTTDIQIKGDDPFFGSLNGMSVEQQLDACEKQAAIWRERNWSLLAEYDRVPRGDKKQASDIRNERMKIEAKIRRVRGLINVFKSQLDRRESHALWVLGIKAVCGDDTLREVLAWMKAEKKRRKTETIQEF